ncbi:MAG TPA: glycosyltransferase family 61 protein [Gemmatimonadaceae bacterium]|nr:glycosyltransferase family 61 protein [Gemmatimonadaceae bacterium]
MSPRIRTAVLGVLRLLPVYRALTGVPRAGALSFAEYVSGAPHGGDRLVEVAPASHVRLDAAERSLAGCAPPPPLIPVTTYDVPAASVATLHGARLYGRGVALLGADASVLRDATVYLSGPLEHHSVMRRFWLPRARRLAGTTVVLSLPGGNTYYHWIVELLPRLELLRRAGVDVLAANHIVVPSLRHNFQRETFARLGLDAGRAVWSDREPHLVADRMIVPSFVGRSGFTPPWVVEWVRTHLGSGEPTPRAARRLYVSRQRSRKRRLTNGAEVERLLEDAGFEVVFPEDHDVATQARLFREAEAVVGVHGSAFTNLVFCGPGTRIVELFPPGHAPSYYWVLGGLIGGRYSAIAGRRPTGGGHGKEDFEVDTGELGRVLGG